MPVYLDRTSSHHNRAAHWKRARRISAVEFRESSANYIDIGLVNNMPDGALKATERQFVTLLDSASEGALIRLSLYALPDVPRTEAGRRHIGTFYSGVEELWNRRLDGLIVTGTEPRASNLTAEPYWKSLTEVLEWADHNTSSTIGSCLAAHAAALYFDGLERRRLSEKRFGLFQCGPVSDQYLTAGMPARFWMPHSRWNDLSENKLRAAGYSILTRGKDVGVDAFFKQKKSLFLFFQGHLEYEANTLLLEYVRDVLRYLNQRQDTLTGLPRCYFDEDIAETLTALQKRALCNRDEDLRICFQTALAARNLTNHLTNKWRAAGARIYGNWLKYLRVRKEESQKRKGLGWNERVRVIAPRTLPVASGDL
jgi:homoserine O-succinyltransferase/O-acetyltransferase